jgi:hypothetical protein
MSIWNKVLLWLIGLAALGFLILAARSLKTHSGWLSEAQALQKSIGDEGERTGLREENRALKAEIAKERMELHQLLVDRPRVWTNCTAQVKADGIDAGDLPLGHGIAANSTLYAFEEPTANSPGRYLGEFNVIKTAEKQISIVPAYPLDKPEADALRGSRGLWTFFNVLTPDNHETFAQLTDEQKKKLLPAETADEYVNDGKPAGPQALKDRIDANGNYVRRLRDYTQMLNYARRQKTILFDEIEAIQRDTALVQESVKDAGQQVQFYQNAVTSVKALLATMEKERNDVAGFLKKLQEKVAQIEGLVKGQIQKNADMAGEIAKLQEQATRLIDARVRAMARNGSREK